MQAVYLNFIYIFFKFTLEILGEKDQLQKLK